MHQASSKVWSCLLSAWSCFNTTFTRLFEAKVRLKPDQARTSFFRNGQKGAVLAEYALAAGLILIVCIIAGGFLFVAFRDREFESYKAISSPVTCLAPDPDSDDCK